MSQITPKFRHIFTAKNISLLLLPRVNSENVKVTPKMTIEYFKDLSGYTSKYITVSLLKKVSDVIWGMVTRNFYKESIPHGISDLSRG
jgi:hypothetical protein